MSKSEPIICAYRKCQKEFKPKKAGQKFHTDSCRIKEWEILHPRRGKKATKKFGRPQGIAELDKMGIPDRREALCISAGRMKLLGSQ